MTWSKPWLCCSQPFQLFNNRSKWQIGKLRDAEVTKETNASGECDKRHLK